MASGDEHEPPYESALALWRWAWENRSLIRGRRALHGGDSNITLRDFIDAGYALLVESFQVAGVSILEAVDRVEAVLDPERRSDEPDNDQSMQELDQMMRGMR